MGLVPKSTKAEIKFFFGLTLQRIVICVLVMMISLSVAQSITDNLWIQVALSVISVILTLILTGRSPTNPHQTFAKGLMLFIFHFLEPKKYYGDESEEYIKLKEQEAQKDEIKRRKENKKERKKQY